MVCAEFAMALKFHFCQWKIYFSQFIFIDRYLKFKEIEHLIHYVEFEMWPALFYVNSLYFQKWNSKWDIAFLKSSLDLKFVKFVKIFKMLILGCTSNFLLIHKKIENWDFWMLL